jgi:hypothetical protein
MEKKICSKCKFEKDVCEFGILKSSKDGFRNVCKECRARDEKNSNLKYRQKNKEQLLVKKKLWLKNNPDYMKNYSKTNNLKNREKLNNKLKIWRNNNKEKLLEQTRKKRKEKYDTDINFKLKHLLRARINKIINFNRNKSSQEIIGCDIEYFKTYIASQFKEGMNWENYGYYGWHIDHIIPLSSAINDDEIYKLCHYTNLQPLWSKDNLKKSNKIL